VCVCVCVCTVYLYFFIKLVRRLDNVLNLPTRNKDSIMVACQWFGLSGPGCDTITPAVDSASAAIQALPPWVGFSVYCTIGMLCLTAFLTLLSCAYSTISQCAAQRTNKLKGARGTVHFIGTDVPQEVFVPEDQLMEALAHPKTDTHMNTAGRWISQSAIRAFPKLKEKLDGNKRVVSRVSGVGCLTEDPVDQKESSGHTKAS
jgi:hypothetical protein